MTSDVRAHVCKLRSLTMTATQFDLLVIGGTELSCAIVERRVASVSR
jgi:hypothetical protein